MSIVIPTRRGPTGRISHDRHDRLALRGRLPTDPEEAPRTTPAHRQQEEATVTDLEPLARITQEIRQARAQHHAELTELLDARDAMIREARASGVPRKDLVEPTGLSLSGISTISRGQRHRI